MQRGLLQNTASRWQGAATEAIIEAAAAENSDLIIIAMKSAGKETRKIFGSTAT
jgi:nucleotide-binding universal stress UspA family protein